MYKLLREKLEGKKVVLLGFGREGSSSYKTIRKVIPALRLTIADRNESVREDPLVSSDPLVDFILGESYLSGLSGFDIVIKSPGITLKDLEYVIPREKITSQTDLFLQVFSRQVVGITGTKGKSTTSSLLHHILKIDGKESLLLGNIGRPAFDCIDEINPNSVIVFELSSHQLEYISRAPHISILLNLFPEHLDAYVSFLDYQRAKMNILSYQDEPDYFIYNIDDEKVRERINESAGRSILFPFSFSKSLSNGCFVERHEIIFSVNDKREAVLDLDKKRKLKGDHNVANIMAVISCCRILGVDNDAIREGVAGFTGLEHRLEYTGTVNGILFYNDSIATIPEACIEGVKALGEVDTLILGGFDRGIEYSGLARFLSESTVRNIIFTGEAGARIRREVETMKRLEQTLFSISRFDDFLAIAMKQTKPGSICLLSPAAASYDEFLNFEMRGKRFRELVLGRSSEIPGSKK
jgi:UDP-N-acetylmuramoyl-L-alanine---L-glutamate ligase